MSANILIAEDEPRMRQVMLMMLSDFPLKFFEASDGREAIELFDQEAFSIVITDLKLPKLNGMEILKHVKKHDPEIPVIVVTAFGSIENAVEAIRHGAFDYVTKPFKEERLSECVKKAMKISRLTSEVRNLRKEVEGKYNFDNIIGESGEICKVLEMAGDVAKMDTTVFITGESGTGKELLSKAIHFNSSRAAGPFLPVNCAAIPSTLQESELFGFEQGAFTGAGHRQKGKFELASGGTLFLDEIGDMRTDVQAKLLRVLESQSFQRIGGSRTIDVNVRIIAATNKKPEELMDSNRFREDLFYRINVFPILIPPLRERKGDIALLSDYFIREFSTAFGRKEPLISQEALSLLMANSWKGNIRELKNVIERAMILSKGERITLQHLTLPKSAAPSFETRDRKKIVAMLMENGGVDLAGLESDFLEYAMLQSDNNVSKAARLLGMTRPTLRYRLDKHKMAGLS
ncbi:MAG: sigma-54 dependent transcriptional regulator [Thermodesulfobacteriota bacterium]